MELKRIIVELSSGSPNSLAALARTHTSYQREAEKALYDTLSIFAFSDSEMHGNFGHKFRESCSSPFPDYRIRPQQHRQEPESDNLSVKKPN